MATLEEGWDHPSLQPWCSDRLLFIPLVRMGSLPYHMILSTGQVRLTQLLATYTQHAMLGRLELHSGSE